MLVYEGEGVVWLTVLVWSVRNLISYLCLQSVQAILLLLRSSIGYVDCLQSVFEL